MDNLATTWVGATAKQISRAVRRGDTTATRVVADHLEQISITAGAFSSVSEKSGLIALARSKKSLTASYLVRCSTGGSDPVSGSESGGTGNSCSP